MNQYVERTLEHLTGQRDIDYVSIQELERIANEYPFFAIAQVLLAKKLKLSHSEAFLPQVQKAALYYTNPYLLHYQLLNEAPVLHFENEKVQPSATEPVELPQNDLNETSDFVVTETGSIRFSNEEIAAASSLAHHTLKEGTEDEPAETDQPVENLEKTDSPEEPPQPFNSYTSIAEMDHPPVSENYPINEEPASDPTLGVNIEETAEKESPFFPTPPNDKLEQTIEANFYVPDDFSQQPQRTNKDIESLDNPLVAEEGFGWQEENKDAGTAGKESDGYVLSNLSGKISELDNPAEDIEKIDIGDPLASPILGGTDGTEGDYVLSNLSDKIADLPEPSEVINQLDLGDPVPANEEVEEQPAPDPFHPEEEEILEEIAQEEADKEEDTQPQHQEVIENSPAVPEQQVEQPTAAAPDEATPVPAPSPVFTPFTPGSATEGLIPFEPFHTVDYFASQGIKLSIEKDPQDKLGKQLRRFTDWLKHMKRIGPEDALQSTEDPVMETRIQRIANSSNTAGEIVTEAMAEVLLKQGKTDQAIEVYDKLSFLHPDKTPYFADKIQKLKGI